MSEELITIASTDTPYEAELIQGLLESSGIDSYLLDKNTLHVNWFLSFALGGTKIQIRRADYEEALRILEMADVEEPVPKSDIGVQTCPACHSGKTRIRNQNRRLFALSYLCVVLTMYFASLSYMTSLPFVYKLLFGTFIFMGAIYVAGLFVLPFARVHRWECLDCGRIWKDGSTRPGQPEKP